MSDEKVDQVGWRLEVKIGKIKYIRVRIKFMFGSLRGSGTGGTVFYIFTATAQKTTNHHHHLSKVGNHTASGMGRAVTQTAMAKVTHLLLHVLRSYVVVSSACL